MRLLICSHQYPNRHGGIANVISEISRRLQNRGIDIDFLGPSGPIAIKYSVPRLLKFPDVLGGVDFWFRAFHIASKVAQHYDAVWIHQPSSAGNQLSKIRTRLVITFHGTYYGYAQSYVKNHLGNLALYYNFASLMERKFLQTSSALSLPIQIVAVSPATALELAENGLRINPCIIPNGMDVQSISQEERQDAKDKLRSRLALENRCRIYISIGRLTQQKRPRTLLSFAKRLREIDPEGKLLVVGGGPEYSSMLRESGSLNNIMLLGEISDELRNQCYSGSDYFVSTSAYEGNPLAALEASSFGLPLILSDIPPHRWILNKKLGNGVIFDPQRLDSLDLSGITTSSQFSRNQLISGFCWDAVSQAYYDVFRN